MQLKEPQNKNYCATIVRINNTIKLENCDNVIATNIFGYQCIVPNTTKEGDVGVFFPTETQLSEEYMYHNSLFRKKDKNKSIDATGYIEDNRRIRAVKFRGNVSNGLFMPITSLSYLGVTEEDFTIGNEFDEIDGKSICNKYIIKVRERREFKSQPKKFSRVDSIYIPEHIDTAQYFRNKDKIKDEDLVIVTQKLHGTSIRISNTVVKRKLSILEKIAKSIGVKVQETEYDYVFGSRKVIKDANNPYQQHYYDTDIWTTEGKKLEGLIPENFVIYGELVGYTPSGKPIQGKYTYNEKVGECSLYVYRVAYVNIRGFIVDLSWDQVKEFCSQRGLKIVPELWRGMHKDFDVELFIDKVYADTYPQAIPLSNKDTVDEGICIRIDKMTPFILKAKSPKFFEYETKMLDTGEEDLESSQS